MATKQNYTQNYESGVNSGIYWSIKPRQSWDKSYYYFSCTETNVYVMIKKIKKEYIVSFDDTELNSFRTLKECNPFIIAELNKLIIKRNEERIRIKKEQELKEAAEYAAKIERENAIIAEVRSTVKLSYSITVCDNENLSTQLDKLLCQLADKYQEKLGLPVAKDDYYGFYQDYPNFSVTELECGLCEFTAFIGEDIVQFSFNGHSSVNAAIINDINKAIDNYIKTGKIAKKAGKKPALKIADKHNKQAKRSKEAIALSVLAKEIRNTCTIKNTKYSPLERIVSDMVRVVSVNGYLQIIAVDKFNRKSDEVDTIKTFTVGQTVGKIDLAVSKIMLSEILEGIGNTGLFNLFFEQKDNNLIITHRKGRYELIGLDSNELITLFHPDDLVVTETTNITESNNHILPTAEVVKSVEIVVDDVAYCEVVGDNNTGIILDDIIGTDLIDDQLFNQIVISEDLKTEKTKIINFIDNSQYLKPHGLKENDITSIVNRHEGIIDLDTYTLIRFPDSGIYSNAAYHRHPRGITKSMQKQKDLDYQQHNELSCRLQNLANKEYNELLQKGILRTPTRIEKLEQVASGHPDNESTQAAIRLLAKAKAKI